MATLREHACCGEAEDAGADDDRAHRGSMPASRRTAGAWQTPAVRRLLVPLAVAGVFALASPASADLHVGLMDPAYQGDMPRSFFRDLGLLQPQVLRYDLYWNQVAPSQPANARDFKDPAYRWRDFDVAMLEEAAAGFEGRVVVTVWRTPAWAFAPGATGTAYSNAPDAQAYRDFVYAAAQRYAGGDDPDGEGGLDPLPRIDHWEIWNEPNFYGALRPQKDATTGQPLSPGIFTTLLNDAYDEIHAVGEEHGFDPVVISGGLYRAKSTRGVNPIRFLEEIAALGARFDALGFHPYPTVPSLGLDDGATGGTVYPSISVGNFDRLVADVERIWPGEDFPIWLTEFGWQSNPVPGADQYAVGEAEQAEFLAGAIDRFSSFPRVEALIWFLIRDEPPDPRGVRDTWQSGLRRMDGTYKPSWDTWRELVGDGGPDGLDPLDLFPSDGAILSAQQARTQIEIITRAAVAVG